VEGLSRESTYEFVVEARNQFDYGAYSEVIVVNTALKPEVSTKLIQQTSDSTGELTGNDKNLTTSAATVENGPKVEFSCVAWTLHPESGSLMTAYMMFSQVVGTCAY